MKQLLDYINNCLLIDRRLRRIVIEGQRSQ